MKPANYYMPFLTLGPLSKAYMQLTNLRPLLYVWGLRVNCKQFIKIILHIAFTQHLSSRFWLSNALPPSCTPLWYLYTWTVFPDSFCARELRIRLSGTCQNGVLENTVETSLRVIFIQESALWEHVVLPLTSSPYPALRLHPSYPQDSMEKNLIERFPHEVLYARNTTFPQTASLTFEVKYEASWMSLF